MQSRNAWGNVNKPNKRGEHRPNRHWDPRHKKMRVAKEQKIQLPNTEKERKLSAANDIAAQREMMKKRGILPVGPALEYPVYMGSSPSVFDPYIPGKSDGIKSQLKDVTDMTKKKGKSFRAASKIRKYDHDFDTRNFPPEAEEVYIKAHSALANRRFKELHNYVTELCYPVSFGTKTFYKKVRNILNFSRKWFITRIE